MIRLEDVRFERDGFALSTSMTIDRGDRVALVGASGAGKSTLLNLVAGFLAPDLGRVEIDGRDMTGVAVADRPVSLLFQDGNLFPHLTAFDNVALGLRPNLRLSEAEREAATTALGKVGLAGFAGRRPAELSGGQQARVALARLLLRDRPIALLDEPFAALDPGLRREMAGLVAELCAARSMTLLMVVHELRGLETLIDRLCLMEAGQITQDVTWAEIANTPPKPLLPWL